MDSREIETCYKKIIVEGVVQGIGFRPFVYKTAYLHNISGSVANKGSYVEINACGIYQNIERFISDISSKSPPKSKIENISVFSIDEFTTDGFFIAKSEEALAVNGFISPDLSMCAECEKEIFSKDNKRYRHFFNSCVDCGPRFSVIGKLPYDRDNTTMGSFSLCTDCKQEYGSPELRRFHAETICCNSCGPLLSYSAARGMVTGADAFSNAVQDLKRGFIVAVKGIGGYHLACSPFDNDAVLELRRLKGREHKPFAVMFKNVDKIKEICVVSEKDCELLNSDIKPVTLLEMYKNIFPETVLQKNNRCGCFLPYTPLHSLLLDELDMLVMTSANISGSAIIYDDIEMMELFSKINSPKLSGVLTNDRKIVRSVEDSVAHINCGKTQILRSARGIAPKVFPLKMLHEKEFLAVGGDLKSAFCFVKNGYGYVSQYFGDLEDVSVFERFKSEIEIFADIFNFNPQFVVCDMHPGYFSSEFAQSLNLPVYKIQHHFAHAASVLAECGIDTDVISVCFDGTGYGNDGNMWGGEFLVCKKNRFERVGHLSYVTLLGADSSAIDAKKTGLCYLLNAGAKNLEAFDNRASIVSSAIEADVNTVASSSAGRLFDAVSAILGICFENKYEGQCAVALQQAAEYAVKNKIQHTDMKFDIIRENGKYIVDSNNIVRLIYSGTVCPYSAALSFHIALANAVRDVCSQISITTGIKDVVLSGGVFQNTLLTELTANNLHNSGMTVHINCLSPPNDGGISLGQAYLGGLLCV